MSKPVLGDNGDLDLDLDLDLNRFLLLLGAGAAVDLDPAFRELTTTAFIATAVPSRMSALTR